jgi:hypothetical protein
LLLHIEDSYIQSFERGTAGSPFLPMSGTRHLQAEGETKWSSAGGNTVREEPKG